MKTTSFKHESVMQVVSQSGLVLDEARKGLTVDLHQNGDKPPHCAEIYSNDQSIYAEIGLRWEGNALCDYDGVFELPKEVIEDLKSMGYNTEYAE
jgi:hypothetical protein